MPISMQDQQTPPTHTHNNYHIDIVSWQPSQNIHPQNYPKEMDKYGFFVSYAMIIKYSFPTDLLGGKNGFL